VDFEIGQGTKIENSRSYVRLFVTQRLLKRRTRLPVGLGLT